MSGAETVTKGTKGRRRQTVPIIESLRAPLLRLTEDRFPDERLLVGPRGGVITTATLRDATDWEQLVGHRHGVLDLVFRS